MSLAAGIQSGFGSPSPWLVVRCQPSSRDLTLDTVSELSTFCITSAISERSLQRRTFNSRALSSGSLASWRAHTFQRATPGRASVMTVVSSPIRLLPRP